MGGGFVLFCFNKSFGRDFETIKTKTGRRQEQSWLQTGEEGKWEREEADRQAGGAIIAGFMYELLIESVVTS